MIVRRTDITIVRTCTGGQSNVYHHGIRKMSNKHVRMRTNMCGRGQTCMDGQTCTELLYGQWTVIYSICVCPFRRMLTIHIVTGTVLMKYISNKPQIHHTDIHVQVSNASNH